MATDQLIVSVPVNQLCPHCARAHTERPVAEPGVFLLPITGKRDGRSGVVVAWAKVADDEFSKTILASVNWNLQPANRFGCGHYITRCDKRSADGKRRTYRLHVVVAEHYYGEIPDGMEVDHIDRDKLNCTPENLRIVSKSTNMLNRGRMRSNKSGFVGVYFRPADKRRGRARWVAQVWRPDGTRFRASFGTAIEAAEAVNEVYRELYPHVVPPNPVSKSAN